MANNWIDELAAATHKQDAQESLDETRRVHEAQVISGKLEQLWADLVHVVQRDVLRFQQDFPDDPKRSMEFKQVSQTAFRLSRADLSSCSLGVELKPANSAVEFEYDRKTGSETQESLWSGSLAARVDSDDNLYLNQYGRDFRNLDEVSKLFLERVFEGPR